MAPDIGTFGPSRPGAVGTTLGGMTPPSASRPAPAGRVVVPAVAGGVLWIPYGVLELLQPWGADVGYDEALGYDAVVDRGLHVAYGLPGSLALMLSAVGLLGLLARRRLRSRTATVAAWAAAALGVVSAVGVAVAFDPAFTGGRILGTLLLGAGVLAAARSCRAGTWRIGLALVGLLGLFLLPLWPLVFAVHWLTPAAGAVVLALHGLAWVALGVAAARPPHSGRVAAGTRSRTASAR